MKFLKSIITLLILLTGLSSSARAQIRVVTTIPDLASIAKHIGGEKVETFSIAKGYQNPHFVDPKPSFIVKLSRADLYITVGLDLSIGWAPQLVQSSRNKDIQKGAPGYIDASEGVSLLQVPTNTSREGGDIHIYGNPHYWLDPIRGKQVADNIFQHLAEISPEDRDYFQNNLEAFKTRIDEKMKEWQSLMEPYKGTKVIAYHNEWVYFEERFGFEIVDFLEPKPGIPPTPSQLVKIINTVKEENIPLIINSPYFSSKSPEVVARNTDTSVIVLSTMTGGLDPIGDYFELFDHNLNKLVDALEQQGTR